MLGLIISACGNGGNKSKTDYQFCFALDNNYHVYSNNVACQSKELGPKEQHVFDENGFCVCGAHKSIQNLTFDENGIVTSISNLEEGLFVVPHGIMSVDEDMYDGSYRYYSGMKLSKSVDFGEIKTIDFSHMSYLSSFDPYLYDDYEITNPIYPSRDTRSFENLNPTKIVLHDKTSIEQYFNTEIRFDDNNKQSYDFSWASQNQNNNLIYEFVKDDGSHVVFHAGDDLFDESPLLLASISKEEYMLSEPEERNSFFYRPAKEVIEEFETKYNSSFVDSFYGGMDGSWQECFAYKGGIIGNYNHLQVGKYSIGQCALFNSSDDMVINHLEILSNAFEESKYAFFGGAGAWDFYSLRVTDVSDRFSSCLSKINAEDVIFPERYFVANDYFCTALNGFSNNSNIKTAIVLNNNAYENDDELGKDLNVVDCLNYLPTTCETLKITNGEIVVHSDNFQNYYIDKNCSINVSYCDKEANIYFDGTIVDFLNANIVFQSSNGFFSGYKIHFYVKNNNDEYFLIDRVVLPETITTISYDLLHNLLFASDFYSLVLPRSLQEIQGNVSSQIFGNLVSKTNNFVEIINNSNININLDDSKLFWVDSHYFRIVDGNDKNSYGEIYEDNNFVYYRYKENNHINYESCAIRYVGNNKDIELETDNVRSGCFDNAKEKIESISISTTHPNYSLRLFPYSISSASLAKDTTIELKAEGLYYYPSAISCLYCEEVKFIIDISLYYNFGNATTPFISGTNSGQTIDVTFLRSAGALMFTNNIHEVFLDGKLSSAMPFAFKDCKNLERVHVSYFDERALEFVCESAFENCASLTKVDPSNATERIEKNAFKNCTSLNNVFIGRKMTEIQENAFYGCTSLNRIFYYGNSSDWSDINIAAKGNDSLINATWLYYSESEPLSSGNYWHFVNGEITIW